MVENIGLLQLKVTLHLYSVEKSEQKWLSSDNQEASRQNYYVQIQVHYGCVLAFRMVNGFK